jgi:hypothetical protein
VRKPWISTEWPSLHAARNTSRRSARPRSGRRRSRVSRSPMAAGERKGCLSPALVRGPGHFRIIRESPEAASRFLLGVEALPGAEGARFQLRIGRCLSGDAPRRGASRLGGNRSEGSALLTVGFDQQARTHQSCGDIAEALFRRATGGGLWLSARPRLRAQRGASIRCLPPHPRCGARCLGGLSQGAPSTSMEPDLLAPG